MNEGHENQCFMAQRTKAWVRAHLVEHMPIVTVPPVVVKIIPEAIAEVVADCSGRRHSDNGTFDYD
jgi:hypothetical protein